MEKNEIHVDSEFRLFLLKRLMQELTFQSIKNSVATDSGKNISDRRLRDILSTMKNNHLIKKIRLEKRDENGSLFSYQISRKGLRKWQYYKKKLNQ